MKAKLTAALQGEPEAILSVALLLVAAALVAIALLPVHPLVKVGALAWVLLP